MTVRKVTKFPEKVLLNKTAKVRKVGPELKALARDMFDTMYINEGVGLSANQVGIGKRIAVINPTGRTADEFVMVNPEIIKKEGTDKMEEGCLSMPGVSSEVKRAMAIKVKFLDLEGNTKTLRLEGLPARIVQHELDHLNGNLFIHRISHLKRSQLIKKYKKDKEI